MIYQCKWCLWLSTPNDKKVDTIYLSPDFQVSLRKLVAAWHALNYPTLLINDFIIYLFMHYSFPCILSLNNSIINYKQTQTHLTRNPSLGCDQDNFFCLNQPLIDYVLGVWVVRRCNNFKVFATWHLRAFSAPPVKKKKKRQKQVLISDLSGYLYSSFQLLLSHPVVRCSPILISLAVSKHWTWTEHSRKITVWRIKMATYQQISSRLWPNPKDINISCTMVHTNWFLHQVMDNECQEEWEKNFLFHLCINCIIT